MWLLAIRWLAGKLSGANSFLADAVNIWLSHPLGFGLACITTITWVPFVVAGVDHHGQLYLYIATAVSLVTQFNLAMIGTITGRNEKKNQELIMTMLRNQNDSIKLTDLRLKAMDIKLAKLLGEKDEGSS